MIVCNTLLLSYIYCKNFDSQEIHRIFYLVAEHILVVSDKLKCVSYNEP